jgi:hypothetical protein
MSLSAIDAMLRERRLAAMRAEIEQSLDAPPTEGQPGRGYDLNQLLLGGNPDADPWTSTGMVSGTDLAGSEQSYIFPMSPPTTNVSMEDGQTGGWSRPGPPWIFPPDIWEPWKRGTEQGIKGLIDAWRRVFSGSAGGSYDPDCDQEWKEAREQCKEELAKPYPGRGRTGGYVDVEECARGLVSERCGGNNVSYSPRRRK